MKVLIATPYFHPRIGGLEHYALQIALKLQAAGWEVQVVTSGEAGTETTGGLTIHRLKAWGTLSNTPVSPLWRWQIRRLIRQIKPDVINVHAPVPTMALAATAAAGRTPVVVTYHAGSMKKGRAGIDTLINVYESWLLPRMLRRATAIICASDYVKHEFLSRYEAKSHTISPGVDTSLFQPAARISRRIVFVGDFRDPRKGLPVLLKAMRELPGAKLHVVGAGTPTDQARVTYTGALSGQALVREIAQASVLVLPSTTTAESFGMVLLEAMACGVPVIGSNIGGISGVISDGQDGLLVPPGDATALKAAINRLLDDPSLSARLGAAGRTKATELYSWQDRGAATSDILAAAAHSKPGGQHV